MDLRLVAGEGELRGAPDLRLRMAAGTHPGRVRERNEDACGAFLRSQGAPLPVDAALVVSDGVGGHEGGELASRFVVDAVRDTLASLDGPPADIPELLDALLQGIHAELLREARERGMHGGMGATVTLALMEGEALFLAQVGDSRAYRLRDGVLTQLTRDDSWVAERERLAPGAAAGEEPFGRNVLTQCLGIGGSLRVQVVRERVRGGDRYLLCSDGLHGPVPDAAVAEVLSRVADPSVGVEALVQGANAAGGPDNIAAVVFDVGPPFLAEARPVSGPGATLPRGMAVAGTARPTSPAGTLLLSVGAALLVAGSAAGYLVARPDDPALSAPAATAPITEAAPTPGEAIPGMREVDVPPTDPVPGAGRIPEADPSPTASRAPEAGVPVDSVVSPPDTTTLPQADTGSVPATGLPTAHHDSVPDGADSVPTPPAGGLPPQE